MRKVIYLLLLVSSLGACSKKDDDSTKEMTVSTYVNLLISGKYKAIELPAFDASDIDELIQFIDSEVMISNCPINPLSSMYVPNVRLGMYVAWTIESIRTTADGSEELLGRFPSLVPVVSTKDYRPVEQNEAHAVVANAYKEWWSKRTILSLEQMKAIDPLANTPYQWQ